MTYYQYCPTPVPCTTWEEANAWINGGRNRDSHRALKSKIRTLFRSSNDDIIFKLWDTAIITYHRDGTFTIRHDGFTTQTTIWDLQRHSPVRLVGVPGTRVLDWDGWRETRQMWCGEWEIAHESDPRTPARLWKCRRCHGTGLCDPYPCHPYNRYEMNDTTGAYEAVGINPCRHGLLEVHTVDTCGHCNGTTRYDYGSKPIHTPFGADDVILISADGRVMRPIEQWAGRLRDLRQMRQRMSA